MLILKYIDFQKITLFSLKKKFQKKDFVSFFGILKSLLAQCK